jgi:cell division GTPase FtsZ
MIQPNLTIKKGLKLHLIQKITANKKRELARREPETPRASRPRTTVVGVGSLGCRIIAKLEAEPSSLRFVAVDTDQSNLAKLKCKTSLWIEWFDRGEDDEPIGNAARKHYERLCAVIEDTDLLFVLVGLGGKVGSNVAPILCDIGRRAGITTVAIVTLPFHFEGAERLGIANRYMLSLNQIANSIIVINQDDIRRAAGFRIPKFDAPATLFERIQDMCRIGTIDLVDSKPSGDHSYFENLMDVLRVGGMGCTGYWGASRDCEEATVFAITRYGMSTALKKAKSIVAVFKIGKTRYSISGPNHPNINESIAKILTTACLKPDTLQPGHFVHTIAYDKAKHSFHHAMIIAFGTSEPT